MKKIVNRVRDAVWGKARPIDLLSRIYTEEPDLRDLDRDAQRQLVQAEQTRNAVIYEKRRQHYDNVRVVGFVALLLGSWIVLGGKSSETSSSFTSASIGDLSPEDEAIRTQALHDPQQLTALGVCAEELQAQLQYDTQQAAAMPPSALIEKRLAADKVGISFAKLYDISCSATPHASRGVEDLAAQNEAVPIPALAITSYNKPIWCDLRIAVIEDNNNPPLQALAFVEAGDQAFGSSGNQCNI